MIIKYISKLFAAGTIVVQIEMVGLYPDGLIIACIFCLHVGGPITGGAFKWMGLYAAVYGKLSQDMKATKTV